MLPCLPANMHAYRLPARGRARARARTLERKAAKKEEGERGQCTAGVETMILAYVSLDAPTFSVVFFVFPLTFLHPHLRSVSSSLLFFREKAFRKFDKNNDGFISIHELQDMLMRMQGRQTGRRRPKMTESDLHAILAPMDLNGDGKLDYREYLMMVGRTSAEIEELLALKKADALDIALET